MWHSVASDLKAGNVIGPEVLEADKSRAEGKFDCSPFGQSAVELVERLLCLKLA